MLGRNLHLEYCTTLSHLNSLMFSLQIIAWLSHRNSSLLFICISMKSLLLCFLLFLSFLPLRNPKYCKSFHSLLNMLTSITVLSCLKKCNSKHHLTFVYWVSKNQTQLQPFLCCLQLQLTYQLSQMLSYSHLSCQFLPF